VKLADLKGKVVFLDFWSTTCAPCLAEMPGIERLSASLKDQPVAFLAVSREDGRKVRKFLESSKLSLPVYLARKDPPEDLAAAGVPTTVILDRNGAAVFHHVGALNWDDDNARNYIRGLASQVVPTR
jgi:thiol-disulfide isomerase/thioredoxin